MIFDTSADSYTRFMGRYSERLAAHFADLAGVSPGQRVLDVGCGAGALTAELARRLGAEAVSAAEPSEQFVAAVRDRLPGVDVRLAAAEQLPFADDRFDASLAQLVVHFMADPVAGLREMARVTRPGGTVGACVWDDGGGRSPLSLFWRAVAEFDPSAAGPRAGRAGTTEGDLAGLFGQAGLHDAEVTTLSVRVGHESFGEWWEPFTLGVGPLGGYLSTLDEQRREDLREHCHRMLGDGPIDVTATVWAVTATA